MQPCVDRHLISDCQPYWEGVVQEVYATEQGQRPSIFSTHHYRSLKSNMSFNSALVSSFIMEYKDRKNASTSYSERKNLDVLAHTHIHSTLQCNKRESIPEDNGTLFQCNTSCRLFCLLQKSLQIELFSQWTAVHCDLFLELG